MCRGACDEVDGFPERYASPRRLGARKRFSRDDPWGWEGGSCFRRYFETFEATNWARRLQTALTGPVVIAIVSVDCSIIPRAPSAYFVHQQLHTLSLWTLPTVVRRSTSALERGCIRERVTIRLAEKGTDGTVTLSSHAEENSAETCVRLLRQSAGSVRSEPRHRDRKTVRLENGPREQRSRVRACLGPHGVTVTSLTGIYPCRRGNRAIAL